MVKFGIVGFGLAARVFHLPLVSRMAGAKVTAVCSSKTSEEVHQHAPDATVYADQATFLAEADIDVVLVLTPNHVHRDIARDALLANKHVIIDKPFAVTVAECDELIELAAKQQRLLTVYHNRRWDGDFLTLKGLCENELGPIRYFESRFDKYRPKVWGRWREQDLPGAGLLYDLGSHLIDQTLQLFGKPDSIKADVMVQREAASATDYFQINCYYPKTTVLLRASSYGNATPFRYYVEGENGSFVKEGMDVQETQMADNMAYTDPAWGVDDSARYGVFTPREGEPQTIETLRGCYQTYYLNFMAAVAGKEELLVTPQQARDVVALIELAHQSSDSGKELSLD